MGSSCFSGNWWYKRSTLKWTMKVKDKTEGKKLEELLRRPAKSLYVSLRTERALVEARIASIGELSRLTKTDLVRLGFRWRVIKEIKWALEEEGLGLAERRTPEESS